MRLSLAILSLLAASALVADVPGCNAAYAQACCKVCKAGKACGNTCISRDKACHTPPGCACDG